MSNNTLQSLAEFLYPFSGTMISVEDLADAMEREFVIRIKLGSEGIGYCSDEYQPENDKILG